MDIPGLWIDSQRATLAVLWIDSQRQLDARHRAAVSVVFAGNGVLFASLFARLPEVQARLGLGDGELGLALLGAPVGLVAAVWPAGAWIARAGSRRVGAVGAAGYVAALALPALAGRLGALLARCSRSARRAGCSTSR